MEKKNKIVCKRWLKCYCLMVILIGILLCVQYHPKEEFKNRALKTNSIKGMKKEAQKEKNAVSLEKPQGIISKEERKAFRETAEQVIQAQNELYKSFQIENPRSAVLSKEQRERLTVGMGAGNACVYSAKINIQNAEQIQSSYKQVQNKKENQVIVYQVNIDGSVSVHCFVFRGKTLAKYAFDVVWEKDTYQSQPGEEWAVDEFRMTEKGYLIYRMPDSYLVGHSALRYAIRTKPQPEEYLELYEKYFASVGFATNNLLTINWDKETVDTLNFSAIFFDLYMMTEGKEYENKTGMIPREEFEALLMQYLPVTKETLRGSQWYQEERQAYQRVKSEGMAFAPEAEVTAYKENEDGTITIQADILWIDYDTDYAFVITLVIKPKEDGSFRYLSNQVEVKEKEPPI